MNPQNSVDEFFSKLPDEDKKEADIFDEKPKETITPAKVDDVDPEKVPESIKDRRHRRLEQRLQAERESNIALTTRLQTLSEMDKFAKEHGDEVHPDIAKMFDSSDTGKENALRLSHALKSMKEEAKNEALKEVEERQTNLVKEQQEYENLIDNELESLEDAHNIDLTSDAPKARKTRREFLELVQQISPKDENGDIVSYADFGSTFDLYVKTQTEEKTDNSRKQEIASRSMQRSGQTQGIPQKRSSGFDGWKQDLEKGVI
jgi:hypothetical protein